MTLQTVPIQEHVLISQYKKIRRQTVNLCKPLEIEDYVVQPCVDVSPPKWHLAHTTWFFAQFLLVKFHKNFSWPKAYYPELFNSYYKTQGIHWPQAQRGVLSRPTVKEVLGFRQEVDAQVIELVSSFAGDLPKEVCSIIQVGLEHEAQHQELLLMDIQAVYWSNPGLPIYNKNVIKLHDLSYKKDIGFNRFNEGLYTFGATGDGFSFDNEKPSHQHYLRPFAIAQRLSSNREYLAFILDKGYQTPSLWLSEGWDFIQSQHITHPLYWLKKSQQYFEFDLSGMNPLDLDAPVRHISYFEADAFARWAGKRLPTEYEWEHVAKLTDKQEGIFVEDIVTTELDHLQSRLSFHGTLWEWTSSPYTAYPGYQQPDGAFGEYNGKFMYGQMVLRGGCLATPRPHYHTSYRNFYFPSKRWMFSGVRLAENV